MRPLRGVRPLKPVDSNHHRLACASGGVKASVIGPRFEPECAPSRPVSWGRAAPSSLLKNPRHSECIVIQFFYHESAGAGMRGAFMDQGGLFSYIAPEARVPANHPLRKIRELVRDVLGELNRSLGKLYASEGRPSIPPEQLLSALLLQVFYGIRSERQLMEQLDYNLLYRWFVGLSPDDPIWDPTTFTKNRDRLQNGEVFTKFMTKLLNHPQVKPLLSDEHFSVDGTLIEAWASHKSFRPKDGSGDRQKDGKCATFQVLQQTVRGISNEPGSFAPIDDIVGGGPFRLPPGAWTDDTSMALCLAESLIDCGGFDAADQMRRYVRWYREGHMSSTDRCFDIGNTTRAALQRFENTGDPWCGSKNPSTAGNGSIMRLAPVVLAFAT